ncbi:hypothetical protein HMPREF1554_01600 [Porphyromonas gingivalis F0569]|nr:hypothetical protein HMPREF1554_01600 [Porphyromonas gingivalis F0569]
MVFSYVELTWYYQGLEQVAACNLPRRPRFLFGHKKEGDPEHLF